MIIRPASFASSLDVLHNIILPLHNRVNAGWSISRPRKKKFFELVTLLFINT